MPLPDTFWRHVDVRGPNDCWVWTGGRYHDDYGMLGVYTYGKQTTMRAHVFALILATGEQPGTRFGLHECDNPPCCNPRHLYWGDQKQNINDMDTRGRSNRPRGIGSKNPNAKINEEAVLQIRTAYATGHVSQQALADHFGVSQFTVSQIVRRETWSRL